MKSISIRELHRNTGAWVRGARKYGATLVRERNVPVATITPASGEPVTNRFVGWKPQPKFASALERRVGGPAVEHLVSADRDR